MRWSTEEWVCSRWSEDEVGQEHNKHKPMIVINTKRTLNHLANLSIVAPVSSREKYSPTMLCDRPFEERNARSACCTSSPINAAWYWKVQSQFSN